MYLQINKLLKKSKLKIINNLIIYNCYNGLNCLKAELDAASCFFII